MVAGVLLCCRRIVTVAIVEAICPRNQGNMNKLKGIRTVLGVVHIVLSIVTIIYCIATWRREDTADVIDAEIVE